MDTTQEPSDSTLDSEKETTRSMSPRRPREEADDQSFAQQAWEQFTGMATAAANAARSEIEERPFETLLTGFMLGASLARLDRRSASASVSSGAQLLLRGLLRS